jgi:hypothetical protein
VQRFFDFSILLHQVLLKDAFVPSLVHYNQFEKIWCFWWWREMKEGLLLAQFFIKKISKLFFFRVFEKNLLNDWCQKSSTILKKLKKKFFFDFLENKKKSNENSSIKKIT